MICSAYNLPFTVLLYFSCFIPIVGNESENLHIHRKLFISALKNRVDKRAEVVILL